MAKKYSGATGSPASSKATISERRSSVPKGTGTRGATPTAALRAGGTGQPFKGQPRTVSGLKGSNGSPTSGGGKIKG